MDNLKSGEIAFIFKGNIISRVPLTEPELFNVQIWCYAGQSGIFTILILVENTSHSFLFHIQV